MHPGSKSGHQLGAEAAKSFRFALVVSRYHEAITSRLKAAALQTLKEHGCPGEAAECFEVPGAYELPFATKKLAERGRYHAIICLGCVIRGETSHFDYICQWAAQGIGQVGLETGIPTIFGVITADTLEQALVRSSDGRDNKGAEAALCALEMAILDRKLKTKS